LPPKGRVALVLFYYQGLSYEEVSEALEIPLGTVKSRIHNAMKRLGK
ncbi:MAG TPA: RNA polymerase subunit sigma-70, partial [Planctomycetes bacterium]|nr:RNA polymerase subunit sigma-70 [Planctomycetota bacterium]